MAILRNLSAAAVATVLAVAAPVSSALALSTFVPAERSAQTMLDDGYDARPLAVHDHPRFTGCPNSSASEGNARQQNFPVKQYGQTSGGYRC